MKVEIALPPNIDRLEATFHCKDQKVIYAWGDVIYNPHSIYLPDYLLAHEAVHGMRQMGLEGKMEAWWEKYIADEEYRYQEELAAHRVELAVLSQYVRDRNARAKLVMATAARLTAPLYLYKRPLLAAQKDLLG